MLGLDTFETDAKNITENPQFLTNPKSLKNLVKITKLWVGQIAWISVWLDMIREFLLLANFWASFFASVSRRYMSCFFQFLESEKS